ncbi:PPE domain-containing protein [Amycolatopsis aidingensis]|uniref:PPE domain-containing protein n=1 Tax=Amycolatopsis aidingensis TaxID=2842453 RepID=UPI001C0D3F36|nr:PPE domain-containing protein [Amycolatopsis aidingensis]
MDGSIVQYGSLAELVGRITDQRFDGYTDEGVAEEIDLFRSGPGIGSIGAAVEALKAVGAALVETEDTLREELGKLGVEWQSEAGIAAGAAVQRKADFSADANDKVTSSAEKVFAQGEAFNRTLYKLPDPEVIRAGAGGYSFGDSLFSLIGFETDHARKVAEGMEARQQAVAALNSYAKESGQNLGTVDPIVEPEALRMSAQQRVPGSVDAGGPPVAPAPDVTSAAGADGQPVRGSAPGQAATPVRPPAAEPASAPAGIASPAPAAPRQTGAVAGSPAPDRTAPSAAPADPAAGRPAGTAVGGMVTGSQRPAQEPAAGGRPSTGPGAPQASGSSATAGGPGVAGVSGTSGTSGGQAGQGAPAAPGRAGGGVPGAPGAGSAPGGGGVGKVAMPGGQAATSQEAPLAKGKMSSAVPDAPAAGATGGTGTGYGAAPKPSNTGTNLAMGATALGAGGVAGAMSGEQERRGRGVGRSAPGAGQSPRALSIGDLPEEEDRAKRNADRLNPKGRGDRDGLLERAAPADGEADSDHVRKFGVDDHDLFTDQRMVTPDVIGPDGTSDER